MYLIAPVYNAPPIGLCAVVPVGGTQAPTPALSLVKYPNTAFSVGTALFEFPANVSSVLNSFTEAPNSAPIDQVLIHLILKG